MTENLAGRGEGLVGLASELREIADALWTTNATRGRQLREIAGRLEAAAPPGTAPPASLIEASKNLLEACYQADALEELPQEIDGSLLDAVRDGLLAAAALATPSPQAPAEQCNAFSTTSAREQSAATASDSPSVAELVQCLEHALRIAHITCYGDGPISSYEDCKDGLCAHAAALLKRFSVVPAAIQEQPAGSAPSIASTSVTTPRKITWFCRICERDHTAYCPAVSEESFLQLCDHCGQSFQGNQHECPSPSAPLLEQFFRNRFNAEWTPELERELLEIIAARNSAADPGSPRKVGEDGASERIWCMECGKSVSTPVPKDTIVRAWVQCPECIEKGKGLCNSQTQK